jgi:hypothetical protein
MTPQGRWGLARATSLPQPAQPRGPQQPRRAELQGPALRTLLPCPLLLLPAIPLPLPLLVLVPPPLLALAALLLGRAVAGLLLLRGAQPQPRSPSWPQRNNGPLPVRQLSPRYAAACPRCPSAQQSGAPAPRTAQQPTCCSSPASESERARLLRAPAAAAPTAPSSAGSAVPRSRETQRPASRMPWANRVWVGGVGWGGVGCGRAGGRASGRGRGEQGLGSGCWLQAVALRVPAGWTRAAGRRHGQPRPARAIGCARGSGAP